MRVGRHIYGGGREEVDANLRRIIFSIFRRGVAVLADSPGRFSYSGPRHFASKPRNLQKF